MALSPELLAAYHAAEYIVLDPRIVIRIGEPSRALDELLASDRSAAFITAANPESERRSNEENRRLVTELREMLDAVGRTYRQGEGRDPNAAWPAEPSFLVLGISREEATNVARRFAQNAFVWCERGKPPELVIVAQWRLVLDTQIWLDWLAFDDPSVSSLKKAVAEERAQIYMDAACEAELERVLGYPIAKKVPEKPMQEARLAEARRVARHPGRELSQAERASLPRCGDRDDQKFLERALAARAHALVTKDRALLELASRAPFRIVSLRDLALS
jgi:predicted nucleic acid-binding protein